MQTIDHIFIAPENFNESLNFYTNGLGFDIINSWGGNSQPQGALLRLGRVEIVLAEQHQHAGDTSWINGVNGHHPTIHIKCEKIDDYVAEFKKRGLPVEMNIETTHWGVRWIVVRDPDDNLFAFFEQAEVLKDKDCVTTKP
ncbi:MAG: VOC family protein [Gammaproteobacteria bacterium]|nr:MAG: VOC family protein [Gammaproteobacteria bacterium]